VAAILLIAPGFATDVAGLALAAIGIGIILLLKARSKDAAMPAVAL
jgi:UPF0716 family protein affecting phage T7 exclusion